MNVFLRKSLNVVLTTLLVALGFTSCHRVEYGSPYEGKYGPPPTEYPEENEEQNGDNESSNTLEAIAEEPSTDEKQEKDVK